jgi:hypothetical protein
VTGDGPGVFRHKLDITVTATATHPAGVALDENGHPVLDRNGQPVMVEESKQ